MPDLLLTRLRCGRPLAVLFDGRVVFVWRVDGRVGALVLGGRKSVGIVRDVACVTSTRLEGPSVSSLSRGGYFWVFGVVLSL
jgi:hypothetical protein